MSINIKIHQSTLLSIHALFAKDEFWITKLVVELPKAYQSPHKSALESRFQHQMLHINMQLRQLTLVFFFFDIGTRTLLKVLAKVPQTSDLFRKKHTDLVNWIIAMRRSGIHKSAVWHRVHDQTLPPAAIFGSIVKSHLRYQFKVICK